MKKLVIIAIALFTSQAHGVKFVSVAPGETKKVPASKEKVICARILPNGALRGRWHRTKKGKKLFFIVANCKQPTKMPLSDFDKAIVKILEGRMLVHAKIHLDKSPKTKIALLSREVIKK